MINLLTHGALSVKYILDGALHTWEYSFCLNLSPFCLHLLHVIANHSGDSHKEDANRKATDSCQINIRRGEMNNLGHIWQKVHHGWVDLSFLWWSWKFEILIREFILSLPGPYPSKYPSKTWYRVKSFGLSKTGILVKEVFIYKCSLINIIPRRLLLTLFIFVYLYL